MFVNAFGDGIDYGHLSDPPSRGVCVIPRAESNRPLKAP
jgi:hypothetical protein